MDVPSGMVYDRLDLRILRRLAEVGFVKHSDEPVTLKSGIKSNVYVFGRNDLTEHPDLEVLIGQKIWRLIRRASPPDGSQPCLIGIPTAGTALAQAAAMMSFLDAERPPVCHRSMRQVLKKKHGVHSDWIDGAPDIERHTYWLVDNVVTDGRSKIEAAARAAEQGYPSRMPCFIFVDRQQGAIKRLADERFGEVVVAYNLLDITFAFGELGLWPKDAVRAVEEEIQAHSELA